MVKNALKKNVNIIRNVRTTPSSSLLLHSARAITSAHSFPNLSAVLTVKRTCRFASWSPLHAGIENRYLHCIRVDVVSNFSLDQIQDKLWLRKYSKINFFVCLLFYSWRQQYTGNNQETETNFVRHRSLSTVREMYYRRVNKSSTMYMYPTLHVTFRHGMRV